MGLFSKKNREPDRPVETPSADLNPEPDRPVEMPSADLNPEPSSSKEQPPPVSDPVRQLERLEGMRDRGVLSQEDFDLEKRKVLAAQSYRRI